MKQGWEMKKLGEVLDVIRNGVNCKQDKGGNGDMISRIETISTGDFDLSRVGFSPLTEHERTKYKIETGDILFSHINSPIHVGKTAYFSLSENVYHGVNLLLMRPKPILDSAYFERYLKYLYQTGYWKSVCKQSVNQASVNQQDICTVPIVYPTALPEQQRIVAILDRSFAAIDRAKANAERNLQNARELFDSYLEQVFSERGEGWEEKKLTEVTTFRSGTTISPTLERSEGDLKYIKVADFNLLGNEEKIIHSQRYALSNEVSNASVIPIGSVIFPKRGGAIATNRKRVIVVPTIMDLNLMAITAKPELSERLLYFWLLRLDLNSISNGTSIPQINNYSFDGLMIGFPTSIREQQSIVAKLDALRAQTQRLEQVYRQKLVALEELRKTLLQKAFAGEL